MLGCRVVWAAALFSAASLGCSSPGVAEKGGTAPPRAEPPAAPPAAPSEVVPRFAPGPCRFIVPARVEGTVVRCGDVIVKENRARADGRTIKIHVAIFPGPAGGTPVLELNGGPGAPSDPVVGLLAAGEPGVVETLRFLRERGDYVMIDARGVGRSLPNLSCAEELFGPGSAREEDLFARCRARLEGAGADLSAYTTYDAALDVDDVRAALGYAKVDLHGISYGTLLALEVIRHRPGGVRSVIVDGVLPPEEKLVAVTPKTIDDNVTRIFAACAADAACAAAFPDLDASLTRLHAAVTTNPLETRDGPVDWSALRAALVDAMYVAEGVAHVPLWIHDLAARGAPAFDERVAPWLSGAMTPPASAPSAESAALLAEVDAALARLDADPVAAAQLLGVSDGMHTSVLCSDSAQYESEADARAIGSAVRPAFRDDEGAATQHAICAAWPKAPKRATTKAPVTSPLPVLSMGGEFDPVTPSRWAEQVTRTLSNGTYVLMNGLSHGSMDTCGRGIKAAFLARPSQRPDASCARDGRIAWQLGGPARQGLSRSLALSVESWVGARLGAGRRPGRARIQGWGRSLASASRPR